MSGAGGPPADAWIHALAESAELLGERLRRTRPSTRLERFATADFRRRWIALFGDDPKRFRSRIDRGRSPTRPLVEGRAARALPAWASHLGELVAAAAAIEVDLADHPAIVAADPIPFEDVLIPLVVVARERLDRHCGDPPAPQAIGRDAWAVLERALLAQYAAHACRVLDHAFTRERSYGHTLLIDLGLADAADETRTRYAAFCARMRRDGCRSLLVAYPVLGRLIAILTQQWVATTATFIRRLAADRDDLERRFNDGESLGPVVAIDPALSDRHASGSTVMSVAFASGTTLVYKPKDLGLDVALSAVFDWCNARSGLLDLRHPKVLDRGTHGWAEWIAHRACDDLDSARRFFTRAGMLSCVLHVLRATDCHHENVIARGDAPYLVDTEALLHPREIGHRDQRDTLSPAALVSERFLDSVLRTGLLPRFSVSADRRVAFDISGFGDALGQAMPHEVERWQAVNTDGMHARTVAHAMPAEKNSALVDGRTLVADDFVDEIVAGFGAMYRFLASEKDALLAGDGPLSALRGRRVRYIHRDTQVYGTLLDDALSVEALRNGLVYGLVFERLAVSMPGTDEDAVDGTLHEAELDALERRDIPLFTANTSDCRLHADGIVVLDDAFLQSGLADALDGIRAMDDADLAWQCELIGGSFDASVASVAATPGSQTPVRRRDAGTGFALDAAIRIGDDLASRAVRDPHGGMTWLGLGLLMRADRYQFRVLGHNLYDGVSGVALFFAALHRVTGDPRHRSLAIGAIDGVRTFVRERGRHPHWREDSDAYLGGAIGVGSIVYALATIARLLDDPSMFDDACLLVPAFSDARVSEDEELDVMGGAAGAILGLLALHAASGERDALQAAIVCGRHVLSRQEDVGGRGRAWRTLGSMPLTGMSHGAAGIAYALACLHAVTGDRRCLDAAREGLAYEGGLRSRVDGNWTDLRPSPGEEEPPPVQWCHGAAGIGLARLGTARAVPSLVLDDDIELALATTRDVGLGAIDHLCCGNFGRVETLLVAGRLHDRRAWIADAHALASASVERADTRGGYRLFTNRPTAFQPGFFQGVSGIGYQLLRLVRPDLPSVLLWE